MLSDLHELAPPGVGDTARCHISTPPLQPDKKLHLDGQTPSRDHAQLQQKRWTRHLRKSFPKSVTGALGRA
jgi:hypothetical protein